MTAYRDLRISRCSAGVVRSIAAVLAAGVFACGGGQDRADQEGARGAPPEKHAISPTPSGPHPSNASDIAESTCPPTGLWAECSVITRLEQAGLVMNPHQDPITHASLQRQGRAFSVRDAELEVFIYPNRAERERDEARVDRDDYLEADGPPQPIHKPTIVTSENLLVVLDTRRERQRERITLALTAGPPQP